MARVPQNQAAKAVKAVVGTAFRYHPVQHPDAAFAFDLQAGDDIAEKCGAYAAEVAEFAKEQGWLKK